MNATIGLLAYGLRSSPLTSGAPTWLLAASAYGSMSWDLQMQAAHSGCHISAFCRNPLHPGPCKGWKHHLGLVSPGALHALEKIRHEQLEKKRQSKVQALKDAGHAIPKHLATPIVYDPAKNKHIQQPDKITPGLSIPTKGLTPEAAQETLKKIPTKAQVGEKLAAKHAAEASKIKVGDAVQHPGSWEHHIVVSHNADGTSTLEQAGKPGQGKTQVYTAKLTKLTGNIAKDAHEAHETAKVAGKPTMLTVAKAGLKDGDKVFLHGHGSGAPQLVTVRKKVAGGGKGSGYVFEDGDNKTVAHGSPGSKWALSPAPGKSFAGAEPAAGGPSGFEKGDKTKMDALHGLGEAQTKANAQTDAFEKMASLSGGKHLNEKEKAAIHAKFAENNQAAEPKKVLPEGAHEATAKKIAAKLWKQTDINEHAHQADLEAALAKDIHEGVHEGKPTPVLDAAKNALMTLGHDIPGSDKKLGEEVAKKLGITTPHDTPVGGADLAAVEKALGGKASTSGLSIHDSTMLDHAKKTIAGGNDNLPAHVRVGMLDQLPPDVFHNHMNEAEQKAVLSHLVVAHVQLDSLPNKNADTLDAMAKAEKKYEQLSGKPFPKESDLFGPAPSKSEPDVLQGLLDAVPVAGSNHAPHVKEAVDYANGFKAATDTKKLAAYQKLTPEDLGTIDPNTKKLMVANLNGMQKKFLDNKKKAAVQEVLNKVQVAHGGGAGEGGTSAVHTPATGALGHEAKAAQGAANAYKMGVIKTGPDSEGYKTLHQVLAGMHGSPDQAKVEAGFQQMGEIHATKMLKDAEIPKDTGLGKQAFPHLAKEITDALKGGDYSSAKTPLTVSLTHSASGDIGPFVNAATKHPEISGYGGVQMAHAPSSADIAHQLAAHSIGKPAANGGVAGKGFTAQHQQEIDTIGEGAHHEALGKIYGSVKAVKAIDSLGLSDSWHSKIVNDLHDQLTAMEGNYEQALNESNPVPGGLASKIDEIADKVNHVTDDLASGNGWSKDSPAAQSFKAALFVAEVKAAMAENPGAGGGSTHHSPAGAATSAGPAAVSNLDAVGIPEVPELPEGETEHTLGGGDGVGHLSQGVKDQIGESFHSLPFGTSTSDPIESVFDNLVAVAGWHGKDAGPLSVLQAAQIVDEAKAKKYGSTNTNLTEKALLSWLGTKNGKEYAAAYATPKADQVTYLKDPEAAQKAALEAHKEIQVAVGDKVQKLAGGPGPYDPAKSKSDFKSFNHAQAQKSQDDYMAKSGEKWTGAQKQAITVYTGSQYQQINDYLRGIDEDTSPAYKKYATQIQAGMRPLADDQLLIRGSSYKIFPEGFKSVEGIKKLIGLGGEIADSGFVSTSIAGAGGEFEKAIKLHIEAPAGSMGAYVRSISSHPNENEMILAAGTRYRVLSIDTSGHQPIVRLRVIS